MKTKNNDDLTFDKLCSEYREAMVKYVFRLTDGDKYLTEDIVQETYLYALKNKEKLLSHPNPKAWLYKSAHIHYLRGRGNSNKVQANEESFEQILEEDSSAQAKIANLSYQEFDDDSLDEMLSVCSERERQLILLHYDEGYSLKEIAEKWNLNYVTVRKYHADILNKLRELEKYKQKYDHSIPK